jgi:hypothetical protein
VGFGNSGRRIEWDTNFRGNGGSGVSVTFLSEARLRLPMGFSCGCKP